MKYLVTLIVPIMEVEYEVYIPINKKIGTIKNKLIEALEEIVESECQPAFKETRMIDRDTGRELSNNMYVKDSVLKNGSKIIFI